ncbi:hypothetical protein A6J83_015685 [Achromobacter xylosoxidans]|nr:hypothetical protein BIZ53_16825 [Achromobacter xylosoxidans]PNL96724.1 hypothetical protein A6J83_015685 [Achromobacter xylosoxidans]
MGISHRTDDLGLLRIGQLTATAHAPRAGYRQVLLPDPLGDFPMLAAFIRFLEELIDVANFGRDLSK